MIEKRIFDSILRNIKRGGVKVNYWDGDVRTYGPEKPYYTLSFRSASALRSVLRNASLGFGEGYAAGDIEVEGDLRNVNRLLCENKTALSALRLTRLTHLLQRNVKAIQKQQIQHHYDLGNDFYKLWLDKSMMYSCAYFQKPTDTLEQAQEQKVAHLLRKLQLQKGQRLLDIGCGWGTLLITAAKKYKATGLGITLSEEQLKHARKAAKEAGVEKQITFELCNYQDLVERGETFDRIISVGMFEHVGRGNHHHYYKAVEAMLADDGITVLHTITSETETPNDPWIDKYIFPGGYIPATREIVAALPRHNLRLLDFENLRIHYATTLEEWQRRYRQHEKTVVKKYDERFYRMWDLWLASSAAAFRYGDLNLGQFVMSKGINNNLPLTREHLYK